MNESINHIASNPVLAADAKRAHVPFEGGCLNDTRDSLSWLLHAMYIAGIVSHHKYSLSCMAHAGMDPQFVKLWFDSMNLWIPIGTCRLKMEIDFLYGTWLNLSFVHRQKVDNTFLISMALVRTIKKYGPCAFVSGVRGANGEWPNDSSCGGAARRGYHGLFRIAVDLLC